LGDCLLLHVFKIIFLNHIFAACSTKTIINKMRVRQHFGRLFQKSVWALRFSQQRRKNRRGANGAEGEKSGARCCDFFSGVVVRFRGILIWATEEQGLPAFAWENLPKYTK
jgi:hypothetical protein